MNPTVIHHTHIHQPPTLPPIALGKRRLAELTGISVRYIDRYLAEGTLKEGVHYEWDGAAMRFAVWAVVRDLTPGGAEMFDTGKAGA